MSFSVNHTDLVLMLVLGFLGSFGHCVGMCGPLSLAFSLPRVAVGPEPVQEGTAGAVLPAHSPAGETALDPEMGAQHLGSILAYQLWLNLGRLLSYGLVGMAIGAVSSVLVAGGLGVGVGSVVRQWIAIATGFGMILLGLHQLWPGWLPLQLPHSTWLAAQMLKVPAVSCAASSSTSSSTSRWGSQLGRWGKPFLLGSIWGLMPCGFLYVAQLKAADSANAGQGGLTLLAFGLGTWPAMLLVGGLGQWLSRDRRAQLTRVGGSLTLAIGLITLGRTGQMSDLSGHGALLLLGLALIARPLSRVWSGLLRSRRLLGVGAFCLAVIHVLHMLEHWFTWRLDKWQFLPGLGQLGLLLGAIALGLMFPAAVTSTDQWQQRLGGGWRSLHRLTVPALSLAAIHTLVIGTSYLGAWQLTPAHWLRSMILGSLVLGILLLRWRWFWSMLMVEKYYAQSALSTITPSSQIKSKL